MTKAKTTKYLKSRAEIMPIHIRNIPDSITRAVIIPACAEDGWLQQTIYSLEQNPAEECRQTLVLVVVNGPAPDKNNTDSLQDRRSKMQDNNLQTLKFLNNHINETALHLSWIDCASPGHEMADDKGVGLARKIGVDSVLKRLYGESDRETGNQCDEDNFVILHLDADTLVENNYLATTSHGIRKNSTPGAVINYKHRITSTDRMEKESGEAYEIYLRYYVRGLEYADSPYGFHTIGSTMCCTAAGYIRAGGIPAKRQSGEDFYFLQELQKAGGVSHISGTTVYPSARLDNKTPFGTGTAIEKMKNTGAFETPVYAPEVFVALRNMLVDVISNINRQPEEILSVLYDPLAADFLQQHSFAETMAKLQQNYGNNETQLIKAFHNWFDALMTFRFIRTLSDTASYPRKPLITARQELNNLLQEKE